jgi:hypothetical protein
MREPYERTRVAGEVLRARDGLATLPARLPTCAERARKRKPGMNAAEIVELPARSPDHVCTGQSRRASSFLSLVHALVHFCRDRRDYAGNTAK